MIVDRKQTFQDGITNDELDSTAIRLADIVEESVVDGTGIRLTIFVQGCEHACEGCHNASSWNKTGGKEFTLRFITDLVQKNPLLDGCTFSGGEPFLQAAPLALLADWLHENSLNVWCYSGYTLEQLLARAETHTATRDLLNKIDVLVDGPYIQAKRDLKLKFRGSANQRIINMAETRKNHYTEVIWLKGMQ